MAETQEKIRGLEKKTYICFFYLWTSHRHLDQEIWLENVVLSHLVCGPSHRRVHRVPPIPGQAPSQTFALRSSRNSVKKPPELLCNSNCPLNKKWIFTCSTRDCSRSISASLLDGLVKYLVIWPSRYSLRFCKASPHFRLKLLRSSSWYESRGFCSSDLTQGPPTEMLKTESQMIGSMPEFCTGRT